MYRFFLWLFLLAALPVSYFVWEYERSSEIALKKVEFDARVKEVSEELAFQVLPHAQALDAMVSLFQASTFVTEKEYEKFVSRLLNSEFSYSVSQIGFIKLIDPKKPNTYRQLTNPFKKVISSLNKQSIHALIIYSISKESSSSKRSIINVFDNPELKTYLQKSMFHNQVLMSPSVSYFSESNSDKFSLILPVYKNTIQEISGDIKKVHDQYGWVYINLDLTLIYDKVFSKNKNTDIKYTLFSVSDNKPVKQLYQNVTVDKDYNRIGIFEGHQEVNLYGKKWVLYAESLPVFEEELNALFSSANKLGLLAFFVSVTLAGVLFLLMVRLRTFDALKKVNRQLQLSNERWRFALEGSGYGVWDWDIQNNQIDYSKYWYQMLGFREGELEGTLIEWESILHPDDKHLVMNTLNDYLNGNSEFYSLENRLKCKDGSWKWVLTRGMITARDDKGNALRMIGIHTDISQLKESEEQVWQHANYDYLTNLPNRRMLYARLEREIDRARVMPTSFALLFLDLDSFKEVNDSLGHDQGDMLLQQTGERLMSCTYANDVVARLGGDEFIILITDIQDGNLKSVELVAQKVLGQLTKPFMLTQDKVFISASMGIVIYPNDAVTIADLIKNVDQAMYASKHRGGNCFTYFTSKMQEAALKRLRLSNDLREALAKNEFFIEYQPIVELHTGYIYKAEALLRWQHVEQGVISPGEFIPIAEDTRLINDIGSWVFLEAIKRCNHWRSLLDERFQVAVNKSAVQFMNADTKHSIWLKQLSNKSDLNGEIIVEITESLLLEPTGQISDKLQEYTDRGVQIALDDFGTGYSSLSYLRKFNFDYLKMDKSFVANLEQSMEDRVLCKAIIEMAHSLGIKVVAEGIETRQQRDILLAAGCDFGQGYYFAKPLEPSSFEEYVKNPYVS